MGLAIVLILFLIFIPFPQNNSMKAVVSPTLEFQLLSNGGGDYSAVLLDNWKNKTISMENFIADRGGLIQYRASDGNSGFITRGDTLGWLYSSTIMDRIVTLEGNISTLKASLDFERSGSKATEIEAARLQLTYAKTRLEEQQKILERSKSLLESQIIPQQEYDLEVRREKLDAIRVSIAEADLGSALSGAQTRKLDVYRTQIADEERKLNLVRDVLAQMTFISPISGNLFYPLPADTLLIVEDIDSLVVIIPLQGVTRNMIDLTSQVSLTAGDFQLDVHPEQIRIDDHVLRAGGEQFILARIRIDNPDHRVVPGQLLEASVHYTAKSVFQILKEMF